MRWRFIIWILFFFCLLCKDKNFQNRKVPAATKGVLDLRDYWSVENQSETELNPIQIALNGEWEFYPFEFCELDLLFKNQSCYSKPENINYIQVPGNWNDYQLNAKPMGGKGFATYRLVILVPPKVAQGENTLGLKINSISTSYKLFINGKLITEVGKVGKTEDESIPAFLPQIISIPSDLQEIEIVFQISNFKLARGGLWDTVNLGNLKEFQKERENNLLLDFFFFGSLFIIGLYHLGLFSLRKKDKSTLYFGLFSLLMSTRSFYTGEMFFYSYFPWILTLRFEYLTFTFVVISILFFLKSIFPLEISKWVMNSIIGASIILSCLNSFISAFYLTHTLKIIQILILITLIKITYTMTLAIYRKREGAIAFLSGSIIFAVIVVNDVLRGMGIVYTSYYAPYGFLVFVFSQAFLLSIRSAQAFNQVEKFTETLENKIEERTKALEKAKQEVEYLNEFSKVINSTNNLDLIFQHTVTQLKEKFDFDIFGLLLVTPDGKKIYTRCLEIPGNYPEEIYDKLKKIKLSLKKESASFIDTYKRKKIFYLKNFSKIKNEKKSEIDLFTEKTFSVTSMFQVPLLIQNEITGVFIINKVGGMAKLDKSEIKFIESFCGQLAIGVNNSKLYEEIDSERQQAEVEKGIAVVAQFETEKEREKSEKLLLNILPKEIAEELKEKGYAEPVFFENVSVMFTDFKGFTQIAEKLTPHELVKDLDACFVQFDKIVERCKLEKLKTIGDSYMCAGGIPIKNKTHAVDCVLAALEIQEFMNTMKQLKEEQGMQYWELRLGIHSGPLVAGVIGEKKFAYDVWGDTVNTASRMESSGTPGKINISGTTYELVKEFFDCEYRGEVSAKNKGMVQMHYVNGLKKEYSNDSNKRTPNGKFWEIYGI